MEIGLGRSGAAGLAIGTGLRVGGDGGGFLAGCEGARRGFGREGGATSTWACCVARGVFVRRR